jgi:hypothetical protein
LQIPGSLNCPNSSQPIKGEDNDYESEHTRITVSYSHHACAGNSVRRMGATQAHTKRTEEGRHAGHEGGDVEDDEIAASPADDGSHEEYVSVRQGTP